MPVMGQHGSSFTWSEKVDLLNNITITSGGGTEVRRPSSKEGDQTITLTATISKKLGQTLTKDFQVIIKSYTEEEEANQEKIDADKTIQADALALSASDLLYYSGDTSDSVTRNFNTPLVGLHGSRLTWFEKIDPLDNITVTSGGGTEVRRPSSEEGDQMVTLRAIISKYPGQSLTKDIQISIKAYTEQEEYDQKSLSANEAIAKDKQDLDNLDFLYHTGDTPNHVTKDFSMPILGENACQFEWVEKNDPYHCIVVTSPGGTQVTRPSYEVGDQVVTLRAIISKDYGDSVTKDITVLIKRQDPVDYTQNTSDSNNSKNDRDKNDDEKARHASTASKDIGATVEVNGVGQSLGRVSSTNEDGQTVTRVLVNSRDITEILEQKEKKALVTIPIVNESMTAVAGLTGEVVKTMETKEAILQVRNSRATYTLPASEINIDTVSKRLGEKLDLSDIDVEIMISEPTEEMNRLVDRISKSEGYTLAIPAVSFEVKCSYNNKEIEVDRFNSYVERLVAIPSNVDVRKITTGVVVDEDGTVRHVPTQIIEENGKYYAKINSLTNSTYSVIWHPMFFEDVKNHWAKESINNMGSRLVVKGMENGLYQPQGQVTRAEFTTMLVRALGLNKKENDQILQTGQWYEAYLQTAYDFNLVEEDSLILSEPNVRISREEAMVMLAKSSVITELYTELTLEEIDLLLTKYEDCTAIEDGHESYVAQCVDKGLIKGKTQDRLAVTEGITRAEVAVIIERLLKLSYLI
jgi:hypothetical protein